jgi:hypothetical protein
MDNPDLGPVRFVTRRAAALDDPGGIAPRVIVEEVWSDGAVTTRVAGRAETRAWLKTERGRDHDA